MRHLNDEAAKTMKYGGLTEDEALSTITINPAKQLAIDNRVGSIEAGKDADIAVWDRDPYTVPADRLKDLKCDMTLLGVYGVAACFSPAADGTPQLPFDPVTGRLVEDVWASWLAWDPVRMVGAHADALRGLRAIWIDAGTHDEWYLDLGAEAFRQELAGIGVSDVEFELFDAAHGGIDYRYPLSLAYLARRLS